MGSQGLGPSGLGYSSSLIGRASCQEFPAGEKLNESIVHGGTVIAMNMALLRRWWYTPPIVHSEKLLR